MPNEQIKFDRKLLSAAARWQNGKTTMATIMGNFCYPADCSYVF